jgi:hypothetical protein
MAMYTVSVGPISDTLAHYLAWAQFLGGGFTTCGWAAQTVIVGGVHNEVVASGTGAAYAFTNVAAAPAIAILAVRAITCKGAWVSGATYVGGNTADLATEVDVVSDGGLAYIHITASSSSVTAPGSDGTNWQPYNFEIWKSAGGSTALPIYVKLVYTAANAGNAYRILMSIGTGTDGVGNLTNTVPLAGSAPLGIVMLDNSTASTTTTAPCCFSGDNDNFRFILWRGLSVPGAYSSAFVVDRAKTANGLDSDGFAYIGSQLTSAAFMTTKNFIIFKPALGGAVISQSILGWTGVLYSGQITIGTSMFGAIPSYPIFPIVGYAANPLLGAVGFKMNDVVDGTIEPVWMYGASHNYLVYKTSTLVAASLDGYASTGVCSAFRWE